MSAKNKIITAENPDSKAYETSLSESQKLLEVSEKWKGMERKTFAQREKAEAFYETHVMKLVEKDFVRRNKEKAGESVNGLIMSVGTSYEPIVLTISLFKPAHILFLYTELTEETIDKVVSYCHLKPSSFASRKVGETDPISIYSEIKKAYLHWNKPRQLYIDFTGGTKAMSAACALAGSVIDVRLVYVGTTDYLKDFRKPNPGSETLYFISNPLSVFGDIEIEKAYALFRKYNYAGARERLEVLKETMPDPALRQELEFVYLLARAYEMWDSLEFEKAYEAFSMLNEKLERDSRIETGNRLILMDKRKALKDQETLMEPLSRIHKMQKERKNEIFSSDEYMIPLMFSLYQNALIREKQEKLDMATLLFYRLLEMSEQKRLADYEIVVSEPDYLSLSFKNSRSGLRSLLPTDREKILTERYVEAKSELFRKPGRPFLPDKISLFDGFIILYCLEDGLLSDTKEISGMQLLKKIRSKVLLRNNSIFAHGLTAVSYEDYEVFKGLSIDIFKKFCALEKVNFSEYEDKTRPICPFDSDYYSGPEA